MSHGPFDFRVPTRVSYGLGRARDPTATQFTFFPRIKKGLIVTDPGVMEADLIRGPLKALESVGISVRIFHQTGGEPTVALIDRIAALIRGFDPQAVIGLGGGSAMDAAKLSLAAAEKEQSCQDYICCATDLPVRNRALIMIPTTSGTGAEVTRTVILSRAGRKTWAWGDTLAPDLAILDPELTLSLPPGLTAVTGLDALVHALEAATSQRSNPVALAFSRQALCLAGPGLEAALESPRDIEARGRMMVAACLAGLAIDQAGTGLAHAIGHALATLGHLPHGAAVALAERVVLPFNAAHDPGVHFPLFQDLGWTMAGRNEPADIIAARGWAGLLKKCGLDGSLIRKALDPSRAGELVEICLAPENRPMVENNNRQVNKRQLIGLMRNLWDI